MTLKTGLGVVQGLENVAIRYTIYDFLLSAILSIPLSCTTYMLFDV